MNISERLSNISRKGKKALFVVLAGLVLFFTAVVLYAKLHPEIFVTSRTGRAAAGRLIRVRAVRAYVENRPELFITPKTVRIACERMGFDMDDIDNFREQLAHEKDKMGWDSLSPQRKRRHFAGLLNTKNTRYNVPFLMALPGDYREEVIEAVAETVRTYRNDMTAEEERELGNYLNSAEGREALARSQRYFLNEMTPEQMKAISPLVDEIVKLATDMLE